MTGGTRSGPLRARRFVELAAGLAMVGGAVAFAAADSPAGASVSPASLGAAERTERVAEHAAAEYRLRIPRLNVDAPIVAVDVDDKNVLGVPRDPAEIGWWSAGPVPGSDAGMSILAGHVNTAAFGPGALEAVEDLEPGDTIVVEWQERSLSFQVEAIERYPRDSLPASAFDQQRDGRLALVSCSDLDVESGQYRDNVVVYALPTSDM